MRKLLRTAAFMPGGAMSAAYADGAAALTPRATLHTPHAARYQAKVGAKANVNPARPAIRTPGEMTALRPKRSTSTPDGYARHSAPRLTRLSPRPIWSGESARRSRIRSGTTENRALVRATALLKPTRLISRNERFVASRRSWRSKLDNPAELV